MKEIIEKAWTIRLVIFDVDGVLTDGRILLDDHGGEFKAFNIKDGHGIKMLQRSGVETAVISGRRSKAVEKRMAELGVEHIYQGQEDKTRAFLELCTKLSLSPNQVAHVGDDLPDLPLITRAGLGIAVADAHFSVRERADWCTTMQGGAGAAREVCDLIMKAQNTLEPAINDYAKT